MRNSILSFLAAAAFLIPSAQAVDGVREIN